MNKVVLVGRLTRDPDVRYTQGESSLCVANFRIAVDRRVSRQNQDGAQTADFISCVAFGKSGEFIEKYFRKGMRIGLSGRIQSREYTNREGVKVYVTEVVAEEVEFVESKNASSAGSGSYGNGGNYGNSGYGNSGYGNGGYSQGGGSYGQNSGGGDYSGSGSYGGGNYSSGNNYNAPAQNAAPAPGSDALDGFMNIPDGIDEELPFS